MEMQMDLKNTEKILKEEVFANLPMSAESANLFSEIETEVQKSPRKVVVLDDDPTGTQTVHGIDVLTGWEVEDLRQAFLSDSKLFYILTNSRSLEVEKARKINAEIARNLCSASSETGVDFDVISRSDSTLRGHYPDELDVLEKVLQQETGIRFDGHLLIPAFFEGGRFTIDDIHYVLEGEQLIPASETEFAKDAVFGYRNSHLAHYIEEKTGGKFLASEVVSVGIADLRLGGPERVAEILLQAGPVKRIIINAAEYIDLEVFVLGLLKAEKAGKRYLVRSSASYVKIRGAVSPIPYLTREEIVSAEENSHGGLVVVGSYVGKTSAQIAAAQRIDNLQSLEVNVEKLLGGAARLEEISRVQNEVQLAIQNGVDIMVYTSRALVKSDDKEESLNIGQKVSSALVEIVKSLKVQPRFLIAKGGITSSDLATEALGVKSARVIGQVAPGISVWRLKDETTFPGMAYVVFPGNVGTDETLAQVILLLDGKIPRLA
jgi:uncharacterized protein YgbK (DUF1537 family)